MGSAKQRRKYRAIARRFKRAFCLQEVCHVAQLRALASAYETYAMQAAGGFNIREMPKPTEEELKSRLRGKCEDCGTSIPYGSKRCGPCIGKLLVREEYKPGIGEDFECRRDGTGCKHLHSTSDTHCIDTCDAGIDGFEKVSESTLRMMDSSMDSMDKGFRPTPADGRNNG